jgi:hypothetical protein
MSNMIVSHKTIIRGKSDFCSPTLTLRWLIRNKISIQ